MKYAIALWLISLTICLVSTTYRNLKHCRIGEHTPRWWETTSHRIAVGSMWISFAGVALLLYLYFK